MKTGGFAIKLKINLGIKRIFDILISALAIVLLLPLWAGISIAIKADSKGPVIFAQKRLTKDGRIFQMYKFRSMVVNAEKMGTGLFNYKNDPRVTKVGRFLRNTSLDELPQLVNVWKGDISIVGPRPAVVYELGDYETLNRKYKKRFRVRGGITGLAQVRGRNENSWDEKVTLDNQYIDEFEQKGVLLDLRILTETVAKVFRRADIYEEKVEGAGSDAESAAMAEAEIIRIAHEPDED
jgi:lipopolysaccharide/colanic/teichoic acid biosynthesis glycosyltransferase